MSEAPLKIAVIVGSNREGRFGNVVGQWFRRQAEARGDLAVDYIDVADIALPLALPAEKGPELQEYVARIDDADGFVIVTPEYNHGYPASLKQAIDLAWKEWNAKPVAFVSYGGLSGGVRAVEQLRQVFPEVHAMTIRETITLVAAAWGAFDDEGEPKDGGANAAAKTLLDQLAWWALGLRDARAARPFV